MKKILLTGSDGQLGRAMNIELNGTEYELYNTDIAEREGIHPLDITDIDNVMEVMREIKPYAVINCAAYTAVDAQEKDVDRSYMINAIGPRNLAIASRETGTKLLHISTDYVFSGDSDVPYKEFDKTGPKSTYGRTKLLGEEFVRDFADRYFIVRTAWLYGDGKNFVKTMLRLSEDHDEISVVCDQIGNPTSAKELSKALSFLLPTDNYGLFHGTCEGECSWADFAEKIFKTAGKETRVRRITSKEYKEANPLSTDRPAYSMLDNYMLRLTGDFRFGHWEQAIEEYLS